jgi:aryl-alcohol dehydrogenase-like predicted oxidoreductase
MKKRPYGKTGIELSVVGFGGILVMDETPKESARLVSKAIDMGINYFDVAPNYGNAQEKLGPALEPYRKDVFLACKTECRDAVSAEKELEESFQLLKTDYFDLYQLHAVTTKQDVDTILGPGGTLEIFLKAQKAGKIKYIGLSAHSEEAALTLLDAFQFDSILFPLNWATWYGGDFGKKVVPAAQQRGAALIALKSLSKRKIEDGESPSYQKSWYHPVENYDEAKTALSFTLDLPVTAAISPGHENLLDWMVQAASEYSPLSENEQQELEEKAKSQGLIFNAHHSEW